ncbi:hypothetical protein HK099_004581 [Clydaea vesicula]|uniref:Uncharacterized protein n=1 Tax=Clydaea vesicula TaxID=447962 RepID=A0AAD5U1R7_9FUNG|nr:hypothetical protein HK099_004581 [Clydaea vesicula]
MFKENSSDSEDSESIDLFETLPSFRFKEETKIISLSEHNLNIQHEQSIIKEYIESYIAKCSEIANCQLHPSIVVGLRLIGQNWPYKYIIVGQSPYKSNILPAIATAYAYDTNRCYGFTPSLQVFSQFLAKSGNFDSQEICKRLTLSYCLLEHSICAINARPYVSKDICINTQLESKTSELLHNMIKLTPNSMFNQMLLIPTGDSAVMTVSNAVKSIHVQKRADLHLRVYSTSHPAGIARNSKIVTIMPNVKVSDICKRINKLARVELEGKQSLFTDSGYKMLSEEVQKLQVWHNYSTADLMFMGKYKRLKDFTKYLISLSITLPNMAYVKSKSKSNVSNSYDVNSYVNSILSKMWQIACDSEKALRQDRENMLLLIKKFTTQSDIDDASEILTRMSEVVRHHEKLLAQIRATNHVIFKPNSPHASNSGVVPPLLDTNIQEKRGNEKDKKKKLIIRKVASNNNNKEQTHRADENTPYVLDNTLSDNEPEVGTSQSINKIYNKQNKGKYHIFSNANVDFDVKDNDYNSPSISIALNTSSSTLVQRRARLAALARNMKSAQPTTDEDEIMKLSNSIRTVTVTPPIEKPQDTSINVDEVSASDTSFVKRRRLRTTSTSSITSNTSVSSRLSSINMGSKTKLKIKKYTNE